MKKYIRMYFELLILIIVTYLVFGSPLKNLCSEVACQNDRKCEEDAVSYKCICAEGFTGDHCENKAVNKRMYNTGNNIVQCLKGVIKCVDSGGDPCLSVSCGNGYCSVGSCICNAGYSGTYCGTYDPCYGKSCGNGYCSGGSCICYGGWSGSSCSTYDSCYGVNCGNGYCSGASCICSAGWSGSTCSIYDPCYGKRCGNGYCSGGSYICNSGWSGSSCSTYDPCYCVSCGNGYCSGGSCICYDNPCYGVNCGNGYCYSGSCICSAGGSGSSCSTCSGSVCVNFGWRVYGLTVAIIILNII